MLFKVGIGIFFLQLGFRGSKQLSEDCIDFKWQNWFSNPSLSCFLEICALHLTPEGSFLQRRDYPVEHTEQVGRCAEMAPLGLGAAGQQGRGWGASESLSSGCLGLLGFGPSKYF